MPRASWTTLAATVVALLVLAAPAYAADGDLDPAFGGDGIVEVGRDSEHTHTARQPDGKIVVAGQVPGGDSGTWVARFLPTGELDTGFGTDGYVTLSLPDNARDLAVAANGRILLVGGINNDLPGDVVVVRLLTAGTPDPSFGGDGRVQFDFAGAIDSEPMAMGIQPDGRIVVAGHGAGADDFHVARLHTGGSLDESFSGDGRVSHDLGGNLEEPAALAFQGSRIVVGGSSNLERTSISETRHFAALALTSSGERDTTFSGDGLATAQLGGSGAISRAHDVIRTRDGHLLLVGVVANAYWAFLKLDTAGEPDPSFSDDGVLVHSIGGVRGAARAATTTEDGNIAAVGTQGGRVTILKLAPSGALVTSFGDGGHRVYGGLAGFPYDIVRQDDGKLVFGLSNDSFNSILARVHDSGTSDPGSPPTSPRPPLLELSAGRAVEGQILPFTATLSRPSDQPVTFSYFTGEGTAAGGRDFGQRSGTLTIPPGQTSVTIGVPTNADRLFETDESFRVELHDAVNARFGEYVAFGTIVNDLRSGRCQNIVRSRGKGTDILTGSSAGDRIEGLQDIDFLFGLDGPDCLYGHRGGDIMDGGDGDDLVDGGSGDDRMKGGSGNDRLYGRRGRNRYNGGAGNDRIYARNGIAEIVECGPGRDRVSADSRDRLRRCEIVSR